MKTKLVFLVSFQCARCAHVLRVVLIGGCGSFVSVFLFFFCFDFVVVNLLFVVVVVADVLFVPVAATSSGPCSGSRLHS